MESSSNTNLTNTCNNNNDESIPTRTSSTTTTATTPHHQQSQMPMLPRKRHANLSPQPDGSIFRSRDVAIYMENCNNILFPHDPTEMETNYNPEEDYILNTSQRNYERNRRRASSFEYNVQSSVSNDENDYMSSSQTADGVALALHASFDASVSCLKSSRKKKAHLGTFRSRSTGDFGREFKFSISRFGGAAMDGEGDGSVGMVRRMLDPPREDSFQEGCVDSSCDVDSCMEEGEDAVLHNSSRGSLHRSLEGCESVGQASPLKLRSGERKGEESAFVDGKKASDGEEGVMAGGEDSELMRFASSSSRLLETSPNLIRGRITPIDLKSDLMMTASEEEEQEDVEGGDGGACHKEKEQPQHLKKSTRTSSIFSRKGTSDELEDRPLIVKKSKSMGASCSWDEYVDVNDAKFMPILDGTPRSKMKRRVSGDASYVNSISTRLDMDMATSDYVTSVSNNGVSSMKTHENAMGERLDVTNKSFVNFGNKTSDKWKCEEGCEFSCNDDYLNYETRASSSKVTTKSTCNMSPGKFMEHKKQAVAPDLQGSLESETAAKSFEACSTTNFAAGNTNTRTAISGNSHSRTGTRKKSSRVTQMGSKLAFSPAVLSDNEVPNITISTKHTTTLRENRNWTVGDRSNVNCMSRRRGVSTGTSTFNFNSNSKLTGRVETVAEASMSDDAMVASVPVAFESGKMNAPQHSEASVPYTISNSSISMRHAPTPQHCATSRKKSYASGNRNNSSGEKSGLQNRNNDYRTMNLNDSRSMPPPTQNSSRVRTPLFPSNGSESYMSGSGNTNSAGWGVPILTPTRPPSGIHHSTNTSRHSHHPNPTLTPSSERFHIQSTPCKNDTTNQNYETTIETTESAPSETDIPTTSATTDPSPPCTPFRFSSFPASLPRVNPRNAELQPTGPLVSGHRIPAYTPARNTHRNSFQRHGTVRKRIFQSTVTSTPSTTKLFPVHRQNMEEKEEEEETGDDDDEEEDENDVTINPMNTSRDDSQNTSISSISLETSNIQMNHPTMGEQSDHHPHHDSQHAPALTEGHSFLPHDCNDHNPHDNRDRVDSCTTSRAVWLSPVVNADGATAITSNPSSCSAVPVGMMGMMSPPIHAKLFMDEEDEEDGNMFESDTPHSGIRGEEEEEEENEEEESPNVVMGKKVIGRTRLNFNSLLSPGPNGTGQKIQGRTFSEDSNLDPEITTPKHSSKTNPNTESRKQDISTSIPTTTAQQVSSDFSQPYCQTRTNSFPSVSSTQTSYRNNSVTLASGDDTITTATGAFTPFRFNAGGGGGFETHSNFGSNQQNHGVPMTPHEVHFRFHLDSTQCSPIASVPDDEVRGNNHTSSRTGTTRSKSTGTSICRNVEPCVSTLDAKPDDMDLDADANGNADTVLKTDSQAEEQNHSHDVNSNSGAFKLKAAELWNDDIVGLREDGSSSPKNAGMETSRQSGQSSVMSGSTNTSKARKLRPMPDMSAFDMGSSANCSSLQHQESSADAGDCSGTGARGQQSPIKLLCPPTPVRTPAWAYNGPFARADSLITSKVLAACPPQVLDGLSSLENSLLEEETSGGVEAEQQPNSLAISFSAVLEEDENDESSPEVDNIRTFKGINEKDVEMDEAEQPKAKRRNSNSKESSTFSKNNSGYDAETTANTTGSVGSTHALNTPWTVKTSRYPTINRSGRLSSGTGEVGSAMSFELDFENLGQLGSGAFADVFKARSKTDNNLYAIKRNRRQFRGKRDRERAMAEVRIMQRLQSFVPSSGGGGASISSNEKVKSSYCLYLLCFIRAWQEDGYFFCQTELCCRDTCRQMMLSLTTHWNHAKKAYPSLTRNLPSQDDSICNDNSGNNVCGRLVPESTIWKICHDVAAGLFHIHSHGIVHHDIKPLNIFFVPHSRLGVLCKIGDFGMAGDIGTIEDGQEGDTAYMPQELLMSAAKHPSGDIFSLGLTLYEVASSGTWELPTEGARWHEIRSGSHVPELSPMRSKSLVSLIQKMINPDKEKRPTAGDVLDNYEKVAEAGVETDIFLSNYIRDVEEYDHTQERKNALARQEANQNRYTPTPVLNRDPNGAEIDRSWNVRTPTNFNAMQSRR